MIHLAALIVAANMGLGMVREYYVRARGVDYEKINEEQFTDLLNRQLCVTIEQHFWNSDELLYVVVFNADGDEIGYLESDKAYKGLEPDLDQIYCVGN